MSRDGVHPRRVSDEGLAIRVSEKRLRQRLSLAEYKINRLTRAMYRRTDEQVRSATEEGADKARNEAEENVNKARIEAERRTVAATKEVKRRAAQKALLEADKAKKETEAAAQAVEEAKA